MKGENITGGKNSIYKYSNVTVDLASSRNRKKFSKLSIEWQA